RRRRVDDAIIDQLAQRVRSAQKPALGQPPLRFETHSVVITISARLQLFDLSDGRVRAKVAERGQRSSASDRVIRDRWIIQTDYDDFFAASAAFSDRLARRLAQVEADYIGVSGCCNGPLARGGIAAVVEIAREQVLSEIIEARGEAWGVGVDLAPEAQSAIE